MSENDFSRKVKDLRALHGLTLEQVALSVGVGKSTIRKWETGMIENIRRDKIAKLAAALHTTPAYLMGWDEEESQAPDQELAADEDRLLTLYRTLSPDGKTYIQNQMDIAATIYKKCPALPEQDVNAG